jgi:hypothetical protein
LARTLTATASLAFASAALLCSVRTYVLAVASGHLWSLPLVSDNNQHVVALARALTRIVSRTFVAAALLCSDVFPRCRIWALVVLYLLCPRCRIWTLVVLCHLCPLAIRVVLRWLVPSLSLLRLRSCPLLRPALLGRMSSLSHLDTCGNWPLLSDSNHHVVALTRTLTAIASRAFVSAALLCSDVFLAVAFGHV